MEAENQQIAKSFEQEMMKKIQQVESKMNEFSEHQKNVSQVISSAIQGFMTSKSKVFHFIVFFYKILANGKFTIRTSRNDECI